METLFAVAIGIVVAASVYLFLSRDLLRILRAAKGAFHVPVVVISGAHDLATPALGGALAVVD